MIKLILKVYWSNGLYFKYAPIGMNKMNKSNLTKHEMSMKGGIKR